MPLVYVCVLLCELTSSGDGSPRRDDGEHDGAPVAFLVNAVRVPRIVDKKRGDSKGILLLDGGQEYASDRAMNVGRSVGGEAVAWQERYQSSSDASLE